MIQVTVFFINLYAEDRDLVGLKLADILWGSVVIGKQKLLCFQGYVDSWHLIKVTDYKHALTIERECGDTPEADIRKAVCTLKSIMA